MRSTWPESRSSRAASRGRRGERWPSNRSASTPSSMSPNRFGRRIRRVDTHGFVRLKVGDSRTQMRGRQSSESNPSPKGDEVVPKGGYKPDPEESYHELQRDWARQRWRDSPAPSEQRETKPQAAQPPIKHRSEKFHRGKHSYGVSEIERRDGSKFYMAARDDKRSVLPNIFDSLRDVQIQYPSIADEIDRRFRRR